MDDLAAMGIALEEAQAAYREGEVPVGAVIVSRLGVLARGHNLVEATGDPTAHAEALVIREAVRAARDGRVGRQVLADATLFVTMEPCPMCAGAIVLARVSRVVFGCDDPRAGAVRSLYTLLSDARLNHQCRVTGGVQAEAGAALLTRFFEERRVRPG
jgi:tRNA(adenine34) deaminase